MGDKDQFESDMKYQLQTLNLKDMTGIIQIGGIVDERVIIEMSAVEFYIMLTLYLSESDQKCKTLTPFIEIVEALNKLEQESQLVKEFIKK